MEIESPIVAPSSGAPASGTTADLVSQSKHIDFDNISQVQAALLTLRKPTELKKVIDCIPRPVRAVPKNGLPLWYRLGLESKLPVPKMPKGKIVFSRGKMGEDIRRIGLGPDAPPPTFDITDPNCYNVTYDYYAVHDPHLAFFFRQKPARDRMKEAGYATKDGRAICTLKEFNLYRKYLYNQFMDRIHVEMQKLDERAKDDLTLKRVNKDIHRRSLAFQRAEKAREQMERHKQAFQDEEMERKRRLKEQLQKMQSRLLYLEEFNKKTREDRLIRSKEKEMRIKQRVTAAAEMELRRKITMIRNWRTAEQRRMNRVSAEVEAKKRRAEEDAENKWIRRVNNQNKKIQEEAILLRLYTEDMNAAASRRVKRAEIYAYNTDLKLQRIRMANLKEMHGGSFKHEQLVKKMGTEFEKSKRGAKDMSPELAQRMAKEAMSNAFSTEGDVLMTLGQARARMDLETVLPVPPIAILDQILETAVVEFTRRRVHMLLQHVEGLVFTRCWKIFMDYITRAKQRKRTRQQRLQAALSAAIAHGRRRGSGIQFGEVFNIPPEDDTDIDYKSVKNRPPTPVPSLTKLAEVTFTDRVDDLPDAVAVGYSLPERRKLLETINTTARLLNRAVCAIADRSMDLDIGKVSLPNLRHKMEWGEAVEGLSDAVVNNRIQGDCGDLRRVSEYLAYRVLLAVNSEMKVEMKRQNGLKSMSILGYQFSKSQNGAAFYTPGAEQSTTTESQGNVVGEPSKTTTPAAPKQA